MARAMARANRFARIFLFFFSREWPLLARDKILYFATIMDRNRDSAHQSQNEDNFPTFSLGLEFLKERKTTEKETCHQSRHHSLHCMSEGEMQQILTKRHSGKTKQMTNWSVSTFKGKRKFLKLLSLKLELSTEKLK